MGWQEEEIQRRSIEDYNKEQILVFWNKLLEANDKLPPELKARLERVPLYDPPYAHLKGRICFVLESNAYSITLEHKLEVLYSSEFGLHFYRYAHPRRPITDGDVQMLIRFLCTGDRSLLPNELLEKG